MIDILKEAVVSQIKCKNSAKDITSLYFDEVSSVLYVGKQDGEVESYIASSSLPAPSKKQSILGVNSDLEADLSYFAQSEDICSVGYYNRYSIGSSFGGPTGFTRPQGQDEQDE